MKRASREELERLAGVVENRVGRGPSELVSGWQALLKILLLRMQPFLRPGRLVTFQTLKPEERDFFRRLHQAVAMPASAVGFYLPPSVRQQMLGEKSQASGETDAGVVIASRPEHQAIIVNALFAHPPFTPAADVYDRGQLAAGYQYGSIDDCLAELGQVLDRHLGRVTMGS